LTTSGTDKNDEILMLISGGKSDSSMMSISNDCVFEGGVCM
jgi:hypothetical protein